MRRVILEFANDDARYVEYYLRTKYGRDKRTPLANLCKIAVRQEVGRQAQKELDEAEQLLDEETAATSRELDNP